MFVDPFESFGWRMAFTTREKELSIREMNIITGAKKYCFANFAAEVLCTVCRSA